MRVDKHTIEVAGAPVFYRRAVAPGAAVPVYLHGAPTSSDDWTDLLAQTGGVAPDLIGFGRSSKAGNLDYSLAGLTSFLERLLDELQIARLRLVGHDWGAGIALAFAQRHPERVDRLVLCDALPLLPGFSWHGLARLLRTPGLGELVMGSTPRWLLARTLRNACAQPSALSDERIRAIWDQFDQGTQRALLRLHRSADEQSLAAAGARLGELTMPALVLWGEQDPWFPHALAHAYGERLPDATIHLVPDAGHWPWLEQPAICERIAEFIHP